MYIWTKRYQFILDFMKKIKITSYYVDFRIVFIKFRNYKYLRSFTLNGKRDSSATLPAKIKAT